MSEGAVQNGYSSVRFTDVTGLQVTGTCTLLQGTSVWAEGTVFSRGRAIVTVLCPSSSSVTLCIVPKWCVLEQKLLLRAYRKSYMRNRLVPK